MSRFTFRVDALPSDVFELLTSFLTGFDLLRFSHVNQRLLKDLLARDAPEWQRRVAVEVVHSGAVKSAKERYFLSNSVRFPGRELVHTAGNERGGAVDLWNRGMPHYWQQGSFSFDLWFALLPAVTGFSRTVHFGGIIFGAQSCGWSHSQRWADYHQQFVHIDTQGGLYCSVLDAKTVVANNLQPHRWYHLALTFDRALVRGAQSNQRVYLNGELVHETTGHLHSESHALYHAQLGSGCISGGALGEPTQDFCGWYGFNGVIDGGRLWRGALQPDHVRRAALGEKLFETEEGVPSLMWSMANDVATPKGEAYRVQCTRPAERVCAELKRVPNRAIAEKVAVPPAVSASVAFNARKRMRD